MGPHLMAATVMPRPTSKNLQGSSRQRMDSTALRSAMRSLTRIGIVVEIISKFARELESN